MTKPRKSLREMAAEADSPPMQIAGKPADVCPHCGAGMFVSGTRQGENQTFRYVRCRNDKCGRSFLSKAPKPPPATIVREIEDDDMPSNAGPRKLTLIRESA